MLDKRLSGVEIKERLTTEPVGSGRVLVVDSGTESTDVPPLGVKVR
jgi:hypothetical protein